MQIADITLNTSSVRHVPLWLHSLISVCVCPILRLKYYNFNCWVVIVSSKKLLSVTLTVSCFCIFITPIRSH